MSRRSIFCILMLIDICIVSVTPFMALFIRFDGVVESRYLNMLIGCLPFNAIVFLLIFYKFGLYQRLWRYAGINELLAITGAVTLGSFISSAYIYLAAPGMPRTLYLLSWFFNLMIVGASRICIRIIYYFRRNQGKQCSNVLIFGAGDAGAMIAREINQRYYETKRLIGFVDDSPYKRNQMLFGAKVLGGRKELKALVNENDIEEIIIAMPSIGGAIIREIIQECRNTKCNVKIVPGIYELIDGEVSIQQLRNVDLEDLLRRETVKLDNEKIAGYLAGKNILVTGAGGSIGSELCRQIANMGPAKLILLGKGENSIYEVERELRIKYPKLVLEPVIADIRDSNRINDVFSSFKPQVVFHAAAHKHVPLMESQPQEAIRNNVFGTKVVAEAAERNRAESFVMISTDKAVNPTSVMGASKRIAELVIQNISKNSQTKFVAVRFGNVLGSRGSVIPLFKKQIASGGPITITHPDMQRFFMTIPEASQLVLQAGAIAQGGEVFVLDMGEPVKIMDMACDLIELSGLKPHLDIKIEFTGLRPGEKLFEELLTAEEGTCATKFEKIYVAILKEVDSRELHMRLDQLSGEENGDVIISVMSKLVPTYKSVHNLQCNLKNEAAIESMEKFDVSLNARTIPQGLE